MIQHNNCLCHVQKLLAFRIAWSVSINYNHHCIVIYHIFSLLAVHKHRWLVVWIIHISCDQRSDRFCRIIHYNTDRFSKCFTCTENTDCCSQRIHICDFMSHDNDSVFRTHKLFQCLRFYPGFYAGILLHLLSLSAVIGNIISILNNNLITATSKCHLYSNTWILIILNISGSIQSHTNTQSDRHLISDINCFNLVQNMKSLFFQSLKRTLAHDQEIFVLLKFLYKTIEIGKIFRNLPVNQSNQKWTSHILYTLKCFLIVIQISQRYNKLIVFILFNVRLQFCIVIQIHGDQAGIPVWILQKLTFGNHFTKRHPLHGNTISLLSKSSTDLSSLFLICNR